jgi:alkylhydroperoxidase family enzyme
MSITKTTYPAFGKIVLDDNERTGIMIGQEHYEELSAMGLTDEQMFDVLRY